jgi:aryl-alcohol dehydrogenase-like predicted oxidoreductase
LTGKYRRGQQPPPGSRQLTDWNEPPVRDQDALYNIVETLVNVGEERGIAPAQVALAYLLGKPAVTSLIVGARTSEQLAENLGAARIVLTAEERQRLDAITELPLLYPYWHQAKIASDRLSPADLTLLGRHLER